MKLSFWGTSKNYRKKILSFIPEGFPQLPASHLGLLHAKCHHGSVIFPEMQLQKIFMFTTDGYNNSISPRSETVTEKEKVKRRRDKIRTHIEFTLLGG